jgi:single-stranded-DNA-specific exonuclease
MEFRWLQKTLPNNEEVEKLTQALQSYTQQNSGVNGKSPTLSEQLIKNPKILSILLQRDINTVEKAKQFFKPSLEDLHDPFLMHTMELAISRISQAIKKKEGILVYGDYDVDGTTAVSIVYNYFKSFNPNMDYYIPDRYKEGYGISKIGLEYAAENNFKLVIALDCGIRSNALIDYANELGLDVIICDHHLPGDELPKATAILNPKKKECTYPYKELSGAGIGFKLIQAYNEKQGLKTDQIYDYLDLVAVSIASDLVDIRGENRVLAYYGLKKLNENPNIGLQALLTEYPKKPEYNMSDIVFGIGPRINAAGRISDAKAAVKVLIERDFNTALKLSKELNARNLERKELDTDITRDAISMIDSSAEMQAKFSTVLRGTDWHKGVIGIVASRLVEQFHKPTIVFSLNDGLLTGSARSIKGFDIHEAIGQCNGLVEQFGGHKYAAGLTIKESNFDAFSEKFESVVRASLKEEDLIPEVEYDLELNIGEITNELVQLVKRLSPFGPGNSVPVFRSNQLQASNSSRILKDKHLKIQVVSPKGSIDSIGFGLAEHIMSVSDGKTFSACYNLEENTYNGRTSLQLRLQDIKNSNA